MDAAAAAAPAGTDAGAARPATRLAGDAALALIAGAAACVLYALTLRETLIGDGPQIVDTLVERGWRGVWMHVLYLPAANVLRSLPGVDAVDALRLLSALSGGVAVAGSLLLARALGLGRGAALWVAALLAVTPALWFQATTIEVHALHAAVVVAAALATVSLPWERPALSAALAAALLGLCYLAHMSSTLLGPGWLLLCQAGRARRAAPFSARRLVLGIGVPLLVGLLAAMALADFVRSVAGTPLRTAGIVELLREHRRPATVLGAELARLVGPLPLLALLALLLRRARAAAGLALVALAVPHFAWAVWFGHHERGGYVLVALPFLSVLAGHLDVRRPLVVAALAAVLATQAVLGVAALELPDGSLAARRAERASAVRAALPRGGVLVSFDATRQTVQLTLPDVQEVNLHSVLRGVLLERGEPALLVERVLPPLRELVENRPGEVALDASYRPELAGQPRLAPFFEELDRAVEAAFRSERFGDERWVIERLALRP